MLLVLLGALVHFGASYLIPLTKKDQGTFGGLLGWFWPWGVGDHGPLGEATSAGSPVSGFFIAATAVLLSGLAALAVLGIWVPVGWWRTLAIAGAVVEVALMILFFGPRKLLPLAADIVVIAAAVQAWWAPRVA